MITFRATADIGDDHRAVLSVPPEVPTGRVEMLVTVDMPASNGKRLRTSLADWAETNAEEWGEHLNSEDVESFTGRRF